MLMMKAPSFLTTITMARCWDDDNVNDLATILPNDDDDDDNNDNDGMMLG